MNVHIIPIPLLRDLKSWDIRMYTCTYICMYTVCMYVSTQMKTSWLPTYRQGMREKYIDRTQPVEHPIKSHPHTVGSHFAES